MDRIGKDRLDSFIQVLLFDPRLWWCIICAMALSFLKRLRNGPGRAGADFVAHSRGACARSNPCGSGHCETALNTAS